MIQFHIKTHGKTSLLFNVSFEKNNRIQLGENEFSVKFKKHFLNALLN